MPPHATVVEGDTSSSLLFQAKQQRERSDNRLRNGITVHDFRPINIIGRGNMGIVLLVATKDCNSPFAMKIARKDPARKQQSQRAEMEKQILSALHHPFLPTLHALFESEKHSLLLMDFCSGGDLNVLRQKQPDKRFSETAALFYAAEVAVALEHLHKLGIVYRDLKPENILIQDSGHIMLTDFDLSLRLDVEEATSGRFSPHPGADVHPQRNSRRWLATAACFRQCSTENNSKKNWSPQRRGSGVITPLDSKVTDARTKRVGTTFFVGTDEYVAPEILCGFEHGFAVDWWTFGVLLYELIYGTTPFKGQNANETFFNIMEKEPAFPGSRSPLTDLIKRLLEKEPSRRLGFLRGAEEVKRHKFFEGLRWESLEHVCRAPFIPAPFCMAEMEMEANRRRVKWSREKALRHAQSYNSGVYGGSVDQSGWLGGEESLEEIFISRKLMADGREERLGTANLGVEIWQ